MSRTHLFFLPKWWIWVFLLFIVPVAMAQQVKVNGVVTSKSDGEPTIGASILEKGTTNGTITDLQGRFTLSVKDNVEMIISYVGYKTITLHAKPAMKIVLEQDTEMLSVVVVTGYTTQRKADLTGAVSVINISEIQ